jgi:hypothetical protein
MNEEVYRREGEERFLRNTSVKRRTRWIGHILRYNRFVKNITEGNTEKSYEEVQGVKYMGQTKNKVHCKKYQEVS